MSDHAGKVIRARYPDKAALYQAYMMFSRDGGIFVPMSTPAQMGAPLFLLIDLPDTTAPLAASGKVTWINYSRKRGVGVRLHADEDGKALRVAIENILAGQMNGTTATLTM